VSAGFCRLKLSLFFNLTFFVCSINLIQMFPLLYKFPLNLFKHTLGSLSISAGRNFS
jgi:hypothetical protein